MPVSVKRPLHLQRTRTIFPSGFRHDEFRFSRSKLGILMIPRLPDVKPPCLTRRADWPGVFFAGEAGPILQWGQAATTRPSACPLGLICAGRARCSRKNWESDLPTYHRLGGSSVEISAIRASGQLRGGPPRNIYQSDIPAVKAYPGPLPAGAVGFEFTTEVDPDPGSPPSILFWRGPRDGVIVENGWASITCTVTKVQL